MVIHQRLPDNDYVGRIFCKVIIYATW